MACTSYRKERAFRSRDPSGRPAVPQPIGRPQQETPAMPSDFHVFRVFALRGTVTRPDAFRPSARICEHLAGIVCCPLSFRNLRTPRRCRHGSAADCPEGRDAPGSPARGIDRGETAAQVLSLCPSACAIRDELPRLYSYSPETPARVCERLRVFCGVPSCRSCREERKPRRQALSRPHCLNPRAPRLCPQLHACEPVRSRGYVCIL